MCGKARLSDVRLRRLDVRKGYAFTTGYPTSPWGYAPNWRHSRKIKVAASPEKHSFSAHPGGKAAVKTKKAPQPSAVPHTCHSWLNKPTSPLPSGR
jgi:hypothetical protein